MELQVFTRYRSHPVDVRMCVYTCTDRKRDKEEGRDEGKEINITNY